MRRFRVVRGGLADSHPASTDRDPRSGEQQLARELRAMYAPPASTPSDNYWDGLEARIMAAVRAGRAAPAAAVEWWQTLARWARPGLAAATVMIVVIGGIAIRAYGPSSDERALRDESGSVIEPLDEDLARAIDGIGDTISPRERAALRAAAELLTDGVKRRQNVRLDWEATVPGDGIEMQHDAGAPEMVRSRREATFRYVVP